MNSAWNVIGGTVTGPYHLSKQAPNQDAWLFKELEDRVVLAVADGAGSLELSHLGAQLAVERAVEVASQGHFENFEEAVKAGVERAREALLAEADAKLMGCTLTLAIVGEKQWALGVVGDSFAVLSLEDGHHEFFTAKAASEYANVTKLLTSKNHAPEFFSGNESLTSVALATDGLELASIEDKIPTRGFWDLVLRKARENTLEIEALLQYMNTQDKIIDDTTLLIAALSE